MKTAFDLSEPLIVVPVTFEGPRSRCTVRLALDTGAVNTVVSRAVLDFVGHDTSKARSIHITTGSGKAAAVPVTMDAVESLGLRQEKIMVLGLDLPDNVDIDGVLGLNFFAKTRLSIDFATGTVNAER